ncbi:MAG TPA: FAD-linked oxidase C-terminal domain-containing protein [Thermotogota bacterium]|nr:FAD-linked oxidase C-terminal domain-containing protein [Thermotogota bacterium]HRW34840.1 FAD-linked oxidase C-terminal domain-containing protein [Thermotogota bacterium]
MKRGVKNMYNELTKTLIDELTHLVGEHCINTEHERLEAYSHDEVKGEKYRHLPQAVVFAETPEQISKVMTFANQYLIPVTPRGAGTGLSGGAVPIKGGIVISMERMNRIIEFDEETLTITVEPGVVTDEIQKTAASKGLLYAGDPCSSDASFIGGNLAENAGGNKVVKYGPTGNSVMGVEVVLPDGTIDQFGGKLVKNVTGYDLVHLMVGSEGTLGIITKIILKLIPLPEFSVDLLVPFQTVQDAIAFVPRIMIEAHTIPASLEFMDNGSLKLAERFLNNALPYSDSAAHLIIGIEGTGREQVADEYERIGQMCFKYGAQEVFVADNRNTREKIWKARKSIAEAISAFYPDFCMEDVVVPINQIPQLMTFVDELSREERIETVNFGHAGDGNMHVTFLSAEKASGEWDERVEHHLKRLYQKVIELGGTLSGEHGIGIKRLPYLPMALSEAQISLIKRIKVAFDPNVILNPGKIC